MATHAAAAGCVDFVLPPVGIARELARISRHPYLEEVPVISELPAEEDSDLRKIYRHLRAATGVDFSHYKLATVRRRIARRMLLQRCETLPQYVKYLGDHPDEVRALFQDILIRVTGFFREPEVFATLQSSILPRITANAEPGEPIRIWVSGCSTGEEVYSIAIALLEYLGEMATQTRIAIFATDISDANIQKARVGIFPESSVADVSPERLRRFFVKVERGCQIAKAIRDLCVFARHDLTRDPPFSRMDLISCRNVLIYMSPLLQRRILETFHYALRPTGLLLLGRSESISVGSNLFSLEDRKSNIYSRRNIAGLPLPALRASHFEITGVQPPRRQPVPAFDVRKEAQQFILERYNPPGFIVDADLQIIHFQGDTAPFLKPASGEPSFHLLKILRSELMLEIRAAIQRAKKRDEPVRREGLRLQRNGKTQTVDIEVTPIPGRQQKARTSWSSSTMFPELRKRRRSQRIRCGAGRERTGMS